MYKDIINVGANSVTRFYRNDSDTMLKDTTFYDDKSLDQNARIRSDGMLEKGTLGLHDDASYRMVFSIPSVEQYNHWKYQNPEDYNLLMSKTEHERMRGAKRLQILHPDWVVMERL